MSSKYYNKISTDGSWSLITPYLARNPKHLFGATPAPPQWVHVLTWKRWRRVDRPLKQGIHRSTCNQRKQRMALLEQIQRQVLERVPSSLPSREVRTTRRRNVRQTSFRDTDPRRSECWWWLPPQADEKKIGWGYFLSKKSYQQISSSLTQPWWLGGRALVW